jgi:peptidyl-tRNA hydrolase, PTH1 family
MPNPLYALIGLGNPGAEYAQTRHNAGYWFADRVCASARAVLRSESRFHGELARVQIDGQDLLVLKPGTFMNHSGQAVQALAAFYKLAPEQILVAHDELDLPTGSVRLKRAGGHGGHNGLRDIHRHLGDQYLRLRIGIGHPGDKNLVLPYVLGRAPREDETRIHQALEQAEAVLPVWLGESLEKAMTRLHTQA